MYEHKVKQYKICACLISIYMDMFYLNLQHCNCQLQCISNDDAVNKNRNLELLTVLSYQQPDEVFSFKQKLYL